MMKINSFAFTLLLVILQLIQCSSIASFQIIQTPTLYRPLIFEMQLLKPLKSSYFSLLFHRVSDKPKEEAVQFFFSQKNQTNQHSFYIAKAIETKSVTVEKSMKFVWDLPPMECLFSRKEPCGDFTIMLIQHSWYHLNLELKNMIFESEIISVPYYGPRPFNADPNLVMKPADFLEKYFVPIEMKSQLEIPEFVRPFLPNSFEGDKRTEESIWMKSYIGRLTLKITEDCLLNKENLQFCKKYKIWYFKSVLNRLIYFTPNDISLSQILKSPLTTDLENEKVLNEIQQLQNEIFGSLLTSHHYISHSFALWYRARYFTRKFNKNLALAEKKNKSIFHQLKRIYNKAVGKSEKIDNYKHFEKCMKPIKKRREFEKNDPRRNSLLLRTLDAASDCWKESMDLYREVDDELLHQIKQQGKKVTEFFTQKKSNTHLMKRALDPISMGLIGYVVMIPIKFCFTVGFLMWTTGRVDFLLQRGMDEWYYTSLPSSY